MLIIYGGPTFNATKVVLTAEEGGVKYDYVSLDLSGGEHKTPEHMSRHALGKIPAIEHNGRALFESCAICRYLAQAFETNLYAGDVFQKGIIDQWVDLMNSHVGRWLGVVFFEEFIKPNFLKQESAQAALDEAKGFLDAQLPAIDEQLANNAYLAGDSLSIADTIAFSFFQTQELTSVDTSPYANIDSWYKEFKLRPSVARANELINS
jgi:glutathione S-transferase